MTTTELDDAELPSAEEERLSSLAALAAKQHGVIGRWQAEHLKCPMDWLDRAVERSLLHSVFDGVYALGHEYLSRRGRAIAALLRAGEGSALSHTSAARTWGLVEASSEGPIHVALKRRRGLAGDDKLVIHRPRTLSDDDVTTHRGVPVTTPERTIRDLAAESTVEELTRMLEQAITVLGRSPDDLHAWALGLRSFRGRAKLLRALDNVVGPAVLRSELERTFRSLCQRAGLPMPEVNVRVAGWELDVFWRRLGVAVELDSWRWHGGKWQFHRDRKKGLAISRAGHELLRLTWAQIKYEEATVVETLRAVLERAERRQRAEQLLASVEAGELAA